MDKELLVADPQSHEPSADPKAKPVIDPKIVIDSKPDPVNDPKPDPVNDPAPSESDPKPELKVEDFKIPEGWPEDIKKMAADGKMTQQQLEGSINYYSKMMREQNTKAHQQMQEAGETFVETWGEEKDNNLAQAKGVVEYYDKVLDNKLVKYLKASGQHNHPVMIELLYEVGKLLKEGNFIPSNVNKHKGNKQTLAQSMYGKNHPSKGM